MSEQYDGPELAAHIMRLQAENKRITVERDRLADLLADYEEGHQITIDDCGAPDEKHCSCVPSLRLEIKRLTAERDSGRE